MTPINTADQIERYLLRFRLALAGVRDKDREEVVAEIRSHIVERLEDTSHPVDEVVQQTLAGLGCPELLATRYHTEGLLERASASMSPWLLLRATMRWAMTGIRGFIAFWVLFIGYSAAAMFYLCAFLKPIFPDNIGLWFNPETREFNMGYHGPGSPPAQELLGFWLSLVALFCGCLCIIGTTKLVRWMISRRRRGAPAPSVA
jgi:hypothetical protein